MTYAGRIQHGKIDVGTARLRCGLRDFSCGVCNSNLGRRIPVSADRFSNARSHPDVLPFASYVASAFGSYYVPSAARRMLVTLSISLTFIGSCFIIAVMYVPMFTLGFIVAGGAFLGVGCAGIFMLWQRYFSSISAPECNWRLIAGTAFGSLLYFMLYLIPNSLTAFLIPVVLLPICALFRCARWTSTNQCSKTFHESTHKYMRVCSTTSGDRPAGWGRSPSQPAWHEALPLWNPIFKSQ